MRNSEQDSNAPRRPKVSAHNWHSWTMPPVFRERPASFSEGDEAAQQAQPCERSAAATIVHMLCGEGMDTFFGLPGGPVIPVFDAILTHPRARLVEPRHESYGAFAAMGYYRACGRIPVVVVTAGPGATNVLTGVAAAHSERVPMLVLAGDVPDGSAGKRIMQDSGEAGLAIERMFTPVTRAAVRLRAPQSAAAQVRAALQAATNPDNPGPVLVVLPIDRASHRGPAPALHAPLISAAPPPAPAPDRTLLGLTTGAFVQARQPLLMVGAGARPYAPLVLRLAEVLGVPFVTTPQAKGLLPESHPQSLRNCGVGASLWARRYMELGPDATLVLGTDLDDVSICATPPVRKGGTLIHVDRDASIFGRNVATTAAALYDVGAFASALCAHVQEAGGARRLGLPDHARLIAGARRGPAHDVPGFAEDTALPLSPYRAVADLQRAAAPRAAFFADIGEHTMFALHYLHIGADQRFVAHLGLSSMGSGICSAVGYAIGDPSQQVICICGDGGMQMAGMELLVAIKLQLPIVFAVFNDARYNMVYHGYRMTFGREATWDTPLIDFAGWAEALGARGARIEGPGQITRELLEDLTRYGGPGVLDIRHDSSTRAGANRHQAISNMMTG